MIVDSRATTGRPAPSASATSGRTVSTRARYRVPERDSPSSVPLGRIEP
jgi:hypothetical protein